MSWLLGVFADLRRRLRALVLLEGSATRHAVAFGWGIFVGCSPLYGFHSLIATFTATLVGLNPLLALLGTQISFPPLGVLIIGGEVGLAEWLRYGRWTVPPLTDAKILAVWVWDHALLSWFLGSLLLGGVLAVIGGFLAWGVITLKRRAAAVPPPSTPPHPRGP